MKFFGLVRDQDGGKSCVAGWDYDEEATAVPAADDGTSTFQKKLIFFPNSSTIFYEEFIWKEKGMLKIGAKFY